MGGSSLLRRGMSVSLAERFRLGTGGQRVARGARPIGLADVRRGCCYGFLAAARCVSGTKEIRRKKPSLSNNCPQNIPSTWVHVTAGVRKKISQSLYLL